MMSDAVLCLSAASEWASGGVVVVEEVEEELGREFWGNRVARIVASKPGRCAAERTCVLRS